MTRKNELVSEKRKYLVLRVSQAKEIVKDWLKEIDLSKVIYLGLPEIDDRYHIWRVPLKAHNKLKIGEVVIDAYTTGIDFAKTTNIEILKARLLKQNDKDVMSKKRRKHEYKLSNLRNTIGYGDCEELIDDMPSESVDLIFTSPPYFNARPEYIEYETYEKYLSKMRDVIRKSHRVLNEGRFFIMNISHVLIRRASRSESSKRIAVPFDIHRIFIEEGYDFIDDIIWKKPDGAGWATSRGRRFAADRNPLQYKAVPVTEYVLVYRKHSELLIDWNIRRHPNQKLVEESKIKDDYERTNIWEINPASSSEHPAAFPRELAEKIITYYSFKHDVIMDPFAGSGTVGDAARLLDRRFILYENDPKFIDLMKREVHNWKNVDINSMLWINCEPPNSQNKQLRIF